MQCTFIQKANKGNPLHSLKCWSFWIVTVVFANKTEDTPNCVPEIIGHTLFNDERYGGDKFYKELLTNTNTLLIIALKPYLDKHFMREL